MTLRKEGTTAYCKAAYHSPAFHDAAFFPLLVADAVLSGGAGLNIWSNGRVPRPQRSARLYRALVDTGLASSVGGSLLPTAQPFLYSVHATVMEGQSLGDVEAAVLAELDRIARDGITRGRARKGQSATPRPICLRHGRGDRYRPSAGYFETIGSWKDALTLGDRLEAVTSDQVHAAPALP